MDVLLVEPDPVHLDSLAWVLRIAGYRVMTTRDAECALDLIKSRHADLALVDVHVPTIGGLELCRRIREDLSASTPLVLLTDTPDSIEVVDALDLGVDDCLARGSSHAQLLARLRAVLRRGEGNQPGRSSGRFTIGYLRFDERARTVSVNEVTHQLTVLEFRILATLAQSAGRVVPHRELVQAAWGYQGEDNTSLLKSHVFHLRRKLNLPAGRRGIRAIRGIGYSLDLDELDEAECAQPYRPTENARWSLLPA